MNTLLHKTEVEKEQEVCGCNNLLCNLPIKKTDLLTGRRFINIHSKCKTKVDPGMRLVSIGASSIVYR